MTANRGAYLSREISNWMGFLALYPSRHLGIHRLLFYISRPSPPLVHPSRAGTGRNRIRFHEFARKLFTARHNTGGTIWRVGEASSFYISLVCFPFLLTNDDEDGHVFIRNFESQRAYDVENGWSIDFGERSRVRGGGATDEVKPAIALFMIPWRRCIYHFSTVPSILRFFVSTAIPFTPGFAHSILCFWRSGFKAEGVSNVGGIEREFRRNFTGEQQLGENLDGILGSGRVEILVEDFIIGISLLFIKL